ncbi:MAG: GGDEF domain-containing protein [Oscillospiraceae bacterium]|nr:GGDEF domain-containing protein [Oscillospiraceae bacterium]
MISPVHYFRQTLSVPKEYREEFAVMNTEYNNRAGRYLAVIEIMLFSTALLYRYFSTKDGVGNISEFWLVFPNYVVMIVSSALALLVLELFKKKNMTSHWSTNLVALLQFCLLFALALRSGHIEIPETGIKNINVLILGMFVLVFGVRFSLPVTLTLETGALLSSLLLMYFEKDAISNYNASFINLISAYILASFAACMYWSSRVSSFIGSKRLQALVNLDALTKVRNRRGFDAFLGHAWRAAAADGSQLTLFIVDVDYFKRFNDRYGHIEGDRCLVAVAEVLSASVRGSDFVARYGGEEFAVVLPRTDISSAENIAARMFDEMKKRGIPHEGSVADYVTFSIGIMTCYPSAGEVTQERFVAMADEALYMAKQQGRNRFVMNPDIVKNSGG